MELLTIKLDREIYPGDMIRACKSGLINLYQEDGQSLTIRA
jgi:putative protease